MKNLQQILGAFVLACAVLSGPARGQDPAAGERPNVVFVLGDDQGWTDFGFAGHPSIRTPNLDRLAREGACFQRGYSVTSLCRPSLATLITGRMPHEHGITGNDPPRGTDRGLLLERIDAATTLPELLAERGYRSFQSGKWWEGSFARGGFTAGMTHGDPRRGGRHGDEGLKIGRQGLDPIWEFVDGCAGEPFFLWYAPMMPHTPHDPPERLLERHRAAGHPLPVARYYAMCEWFDETCGALFDGLAERGLGENTLVLFAVDNGWIQRTEGSGFAARSKRSPYDGGVRTPILVRWPGHVTPGEREELASTLDFVPTVLAACGIQLAPELPGIDLVALAAGTAPAREGIFGEVYDHDVADLEEPTRGLRERFTVQGPWKLIRPAEANRAPELYQLLEDPHEQDDRAAREPEVVARLSAALDAAWAGPGQRPPNLLFLLTDDQRADLLGCAGHPILQTPSIDALAAEGVRFENAFVTTAICAASRATILTGLVRRTHGFTFGTPPLAARFPTYPQLLRAGGYETGFVGKLGVRLETPPKELFDFFRPLSPPYLPKPREDGSVPKHLTERTADAAIEFLRGRDRDRPFCLSISFNAPHAEDSNPEQYVWPPELDGLYEDVVLPPPPLSEPEVFESLPAFLRASLGRERWGWRFDTEAKRVQRTRAYYRMITGVDRAIGRIREELRAQGLDQDTVIVFASDNGYFLGERGLAGKWLIYEESIRIPCIVRDPRLPAARRGSVVTSLALNLDLPATFLDVAGLPIPAAFQGRSLLPAARGEDTAPPRRDFFYEHLFEHPRIPKSEGVRDERWTYVRYFEQDPVHEQLFDRQTDPLQLHDLSRDPAAADTLRTLRARCDTLRANY